jgi:hypothetical protein
LNAALINEICDARVSIKASYRRWRAAIHAASLRGLSTELGCGTSFIQSSKRRIGAVWICRAWLSKRRDAVKIPDYIAIGVLVVLFVWAVAGQFPRDKL